MQGNKGEGEKSGKNTTYWGEMEGEMKTREGDKARGSKRDAEKTRT